MNENPLTSTPSVTRFSVGGSSGGSVRKRSIIPQSRISRVRDEECNDDEAERSSLVASERAVATSTPQSPRRATDSMTSTSHEEHFQGCLKLYTENKITKDNAWNLQLIDFMTSMLRRHDPRMENLQTASTLVDASARIYSLRVDAVHYNVLKMAGGLSKAAQSKRGKKDENQDTQDDGAADGDGAVQVKKKKKRAKSAIAANPEVLYGDFDTHECLDPFFEMLAATAGDVTSSNRSFNATLPIHNKTMALILRTDDKFLEPIKENTSGKIDLSACITLPKKLLPEFKETDQICEPFFGFSISNWDPETEDVGERVHNWLEDNKLNLSQQAMAFDVNAEVEPIQQDADHNDLYDEEPLGGIESEEEADVALAACVARAAACALGAGGGAGAGAPPRLTDMRPTAAADSRLEYSYSAAIEAAWAGPRHWRLKNNRASKQSERIASMAERVAVEGKRATRAKRALEFLGAGLAFDWRASPGAEYEPAAPGKVTISRKTLATAHTWNEANFKTPIDRGLDESHFRKLFLLRNVTLFRKKNIENSKQPEPEPLTLEEPKDYDYNNENDASYCPNNIPDGDEWGNEDGAAAGDPHHQANANANANATDIQGIGELLEPPTKIAKIFIPYAMRAKKVDMKQLKHCMWAMLTEKTPPGEKEKVEPNNFSVLYSRLPNKLSTNMRESLSVPLALLSILHLANEKGLVLKQDEHLKDIRVKGLIKG